MIWFLWFACATPAPRPNILLVSLDTTRADAIGAFGGNPEITPNIDALAAQGTKFTRAYTVTPLTIPAHSSLFTGLFPPEHGVRDNGDYFLPSSANTMAERLSAQGYATMASVGAEVTSHHWGFAQGFDAFNDDMGDARETTNNRWRVERPGDRVVDDALAWLTVQPQDKPWFAWVHLFDAHHPYAPPDGYSKPGRIPYLGEVAFADAQVGRLVDALRARDDLKNTLIIIVGDHGEGLGSHGEAMHGVLLYDATTHIPMIIRPPGGRAAAGQQDFPTSLVDILPTVLHASGAAADPSLEGLDLSPWLTAEPAAADRAVYAESLYAFHHYGWAPQRAYIDSGYKLIDSTTPELYEKSDRREATNLATTDVPRFTAMKTALDTLSTRIEPKVAAEKVEMSADQTAQLAALGYVTASADTTALSWNSGLPDPVSRLTVLRDAEGARQALQMGDLVGAKAKLEAVIAAEPGLVDQRLTLVTVLTQLGETDAALVLAESSEAQQPSSQGKTAIAMLRVRRGETDASLDLLREALATDAYLEAAWIPYLSLLFSLRDPTFDAEVERASGLLPTSSGIQGFVGISKALDGDNEGARPLLEDSLARDPRQALIRHFLGVVYLSETQLDRAESMFLDEIAAFPPGVPSRQMLVRMYADQRRYDEQLAQLAEIAKVEAPNPLTMHSAAQALFNLGRYDEAYTRTEECRVAAPEYAGCAMLEANVLKKLGRGDEALAAYEVALKLAGQNPPSDKPPEVLPPTPDQLPIFNAPK